MIKLTGKMLRTRQVYVNIKSIQVTFLNITQMAQIDEKQEAIARIRMAVDNDVAARAKIEAEAGLNEDFKEVTLFESNHDQSVWAAPKNIDGYSPHWKFGSPEKPINSRALETEISLLHPSHDSSFKEFDEHLRDFLSLCLPDEAIQYEDPIVVSLCVTPSR